MDATLVLLKEVDERLHLAKVLAVDHEGGVGGQVAELIAAIVPRYRSRARGFIGFVDGFVSCFHIAPRALLIFLLLHPLLFFFLGLSLYLSSASDTVLDSLLRLSSLSATTRSSAAARPHRASTCGVDATRATAPKEETEDGIAKGEAQGGNED